MLNLNDTHTEARTAARRADRFNARHTLWSESSLSRVRSCGRSPQSKAAGVVIKVTDGPVRSAGFANLQHCASVWSCPVCSAKIAADRQGQIAKALTAWVAGVAPAGSFGGSGIVPAFGRVALVTLTMRHHRGQSLESLWDAVGESWNLVASGAGWAADQLRYGERGEWIRKVGKTWEIVMLGSIPIIRVVEVTYGGFGWHVHIHALLLLPASASDSSVAVLGRSMWTRWLAALEARGFDCDRVHGVDARLLKGEPGAALGEYFTKAVYQGSMEVARADMKKANHGNRTPFKVLADVVDIGDAEDLDIWHEYERGSKGRRQITWSHGLRARLLPACEVEERTEQEIADADADGVAVAEINADLWREIIRRRADYRLLRAFESSNRDGFALLFELADDAADSSAAEWAALLAAADPNRHRWQKR